ncbi:MULTISPECIES: non-hydrolyzing UDP-N-acetylglucosamine 2-epimerase [unclassified Leeuwenhoekiella]|uniref:non-hydrolyzing UDP-N-acetylglucosamine 2-epimerase n=1 Tax=unclassified Leeuwenhoekiella TaxID=2615029 RepID=UPI000C68FD4F|nr:MULTISPECIES: UDP-N-acetylglucosamine 2-epimerase (non-hydrolyzing) [unclassified Leeuwenhoekiella]MAW94823.1 UDP-N-acetylglucosamine 2-epimerase (non-hydrolyzing) [Leeuwenhoekiella sp.]MBA79543.1 UDP-N-acetylglucosamine 2-epimerase (non-hydrolyzing) [Leeuwenhoekiella sp.]|tara:strand:- start:10744 stop:11871 length:1128 start_codon:yes stop_codon:yes gene_type:complete
MGDYKGRKKVLFVFGTRPEAIKLAPVIRLFQSDKVFETRVCLTAQHREMLDQVLDFFEIRGDYDLDLMRKNQDLFDLTARILTALKEPLADFKPDLVCVHGDTTTTMATSLAAFYAGCKVAHIEAGLRTFNKHSPFPEELNRQITGRIADFHFAPTSRASANLEAEGIHSESVFVTGNTVIDALQLTVKKVETLQPAFAASIPFQEKKIILITGHRRENFGKGMRRICEALKSLAQQRPDIHLVYPVHLNPNVKNTVFDILGELKNCSLIEPLQYPDFVWLMNKSFLIVTDSGGVQEEAPSLGKPVLVTRDTTERPEAVDAGTVLLTGTNPKKLSEGILTLLDDKAHYNAMSKAHNPYGDGKSAQRILELLKDML